MFVVGLLCFFLAVAVFCHETSVGKYLRTILIETPAAKLAKLTWAKMIVTVGLTMVLLGALYVGLNVHDGIVVFYALPEAIAWMAAFDIATLLELTIAITLAAAYVRVDEAVRFVALKIARLLGLNPVRLMNAARARRTRPRRPVRNANDNDASGAEAYASAA